MAQIRWHFTPRTFPPLPGILETGVCMTEGQLPLSAESVAADASGAVAAGEPPYTPVPTSISTTDDLSIAKPTNVRYVVLAWACSLSMLTYIDRVCIKQ